MTNEERKAIEYRRDVEIPRLRQLSMFIETLHDDANGLVDILLQDVAGLDFDSLDDWDESKAVAGKTVRLSQLHGVFGMEMDISQEDHEYPLDYVIRRLREYRTFWDAF